MTIESFMSGKSPFVPSESGYLETGRLEFSVNLSENIDSLWGNLRKDQREKIKRLKREGVSIEIGNALEDLQGLRSTREATQAKRSLHGQGYQLSGDDKFYESIHEYLVKRGVATLFIARHKGEAIAALFFITFNKRACSVFSGSTDLGYKLGAQSGLFWTAVETFKSQGFEELNRGGVPASAVSESDPLHGIYLFKLRLGATPLMCRSGEKVLNPLADSLIRLRDRLRTLRKTT
jgi:lipid II:glycine glycyltransferase (peptidoglycan interpeptide bridge formation enzyme)